MRHLGLVCPPLSGHLNPMLTLGGVLRERGHRVTLCGPLDARDRAETAGIGFVPLARDDYPAGTLARMAAELGGLRGRRALRFTIAELTRAAMILVRDLEGALRAERIDGLLVDQVSPAAGSVADGLDVPYVSVANALAINQEAAVPPVVTPWTCDRSPLARLRNRAAYAVLNRYLLPSVRLVNAYRRQRGLPRYRSLADWFSTRAQIAQQPRAFDFPRRSLPDSFHYTGPFHREGRDRHIPFDKDRLDGRRLVYASMGTLQNRLLPVFDAIAAACADLEVQLVLALGGGGAELPRLPGDPIVVDLAPQLDLVGRAAAVITHAGLNTALECLARGVPMVAIPVTNDQPGVAARIAWVGAGVVVPLRQLTATRLRNALSTVLEAPDCRARARDLAREIAAGDGLNRAAEIVERAL